MFRSSVSTLAAVLIGGCSLFPPSHLGGIGVTVTPEDYGRRLCGYLEPETYTTCVNDVIGRFEQPRPDLPPPGHSTSGPFAVVMEGRLYLGDYRSTVFDASFRVASESRQCRGGYSAGAGAKDGIFEVQCDDGRVGWAELIRADGRNGIGRLMLDDGTQGDIVFGHVPLGTAEPYPYRP